MSLCMYTRIYPRDASLGEFWRGILFVAECIDFTGGLRRRFCRLDRQGGTAGELRAGISEIIKAAGHRMATFEGMNLSAGRHD
jgi:hypothetical protein